MEFLVLPEDSTNEEAETQTEQQIGEDTTENGSLDDAHTSIAIVLEKDHKEDDLDEGSKSGFENDTKDLWQLARQLLSRESQEIGRRNHGDVRQDEDPQMLIGSGPVHGHGGRHKWPQNVDPSAGCA